MTAFKLWLYGPFYDLPVELKRLLLSLPGLNLDPPQLTREEVLSLWTCVVDVQRQNPELSDTLARWANEIAAFCPAISTDDHFDYVQDTFIELETYSLSPTPGDAADIKWQSIRNFLSALKA